MRALGFVPMCLLAACVPELHSPDNDSGAVESTWEAPDNDWPMSAPPAGLQSDGFNVGDVPPDFLLPDQYGKDVSLWQFYGSVVLLDVSAGWCGPCRVLAQTTQETYEEYADQGFMYITLLAENTEYEEATQEDLVEWAESYGIEAPVIADTSGYADMVDPNTGWPALLLIDRDMTIAVERVTTNDPAIRAAVEELLD